MPWLTGDDPESATTCRALLVPDDETFKAAVRGALLELTYVYNWEQEGDLTPDEAAALAFEMFLTYENQPCEGGSMQHVQTLEGTAGSFVFEEIPQDGRDLIVEFEARSNNGGVSDAISVLISEVTSSNYRWGYEYHTLESGVAVTDWNVGDDHIEFANAVVGAGALSDTYNHGRLEFLNYQDGVGRKTVKFENWNPRNAAGANYPNVQHGLGMLDLPSTDVTSIEIEPVNGTLLTGKFSLYKRMAD